MLEVLEPVPETLANFAGTTTGATSGATNSAQATPRATNDATIFPFVHDGCCACWPSQRSRTCLHGDATHQWKEKNMTLFEKLVSKFLAPYVGHTPACAVKGRARSVSVSKA